MTRSSSKPNYSFLQDPLASSFPHFEPPIKNISQDTPDSFAVTSDGTVTRVTGLLTVAQSDIRPRCPSLSTAANPVAPAVGESDDLKSRNRSTTWSSSNRAASTERQTSPLSHLTPNKVLSAGISRPNTLPVVGPQSHSQAVSCTVDRLVSWLVS